MDDFEKKILGIFSGSDNSTRSYSSREPDIDLDENSALTQLSDHLKVPKKWVSDAITFESSWDPNAENKNSGASGLIQFTNSTARDMGYNSAYDLVSKHPTRSSQLSGPVKDYLSARGPFKDERDFYLSIFYPKGRKLSDDTVMPDEARRQNPGIVTVGDYVKLLKKNVAGMDTENPSSFAISDRTSFEEGIAQIYGIPYSKPEEAIAPTEEAIEQPFLEQPGVATLPTSTSALPDPVVEGSLESGLDGGFNRQYNSPPQETTRIAQPNLKSYDDLPKKEELRQGKPSAGEIAKISAKKWEEGMAFTAKAIIDASSLMYTGAAPFYSVIGLVPGHTGEWGKKMAKSSKLIGREVRKTGEAVTEFWKLTPEQEQAKKKGGLAAELAVGTAQAVSFIMQMVAAGGPQQALKAASMFGKTYGPKATEFLIERLSPKTVHHLANAIAFAEVSAAHGEATGGVAGAAQGAVEGATMALGLGAMGAGIGRLTKNLSPILTNAIKRTAMAGTFSGLTMAQGGTTTEGIAQGIIGFGFPVGKKETFKKAEVSSGQQKPTADGSAQIKEPIVSNVETGKPEQLAQPDIKQPTKKKAAEVTDEEFLGLTPEEQLSHFNEVRQQSELNHVTNRPGIGHFKRTFKNATNNETTPVWVAVGDINGFKDYNDRILGSGGTDRMNSTLYDKAKANLDPGIHLSNIHGDEYIAHNTSKEILVASIKKAMEAIAADPITGNDGKLYKPTFSWRIRQATTSDEVGDIQPKGFGKNKINVENSDNTSYTINGADSVKPEEIVTRREKDGNDVSDELLRGERDANTEGVQGTVNEQATGERPGIQTKDGQAAEHASRGSTPAEKATADNKELVDYFDHLSYDDFYSIISENSTKDISLFPPRIQKIILERRKPAQDQSESSDPIEAAEANVAKAESALDNAKLALGIIPTKTGSLPKEEATNSRFEKYLSNMSPERRSQMGDITAQDFTPDEVYQILKNQNEGRDNANAEYLKAKKNLNQAEAELEDALFGKSKFEPDTQAALDEISSENKPPDVFPQPKTIPPGKKVAAVLNNGKLYTATNHGIANNSLNAALKDKSSGEKLAKDFNGNLLVDSDGKITDKATGEVLGNVKDFPIVDGPKVAGKTDVQKFQEKRDAEQGDLGGTSEAASIGEFSEREKLALQEGERKGEEPPPPKAEQDEFPLTFPIELPEAVQLLKDLGGDPKVVQKFRNSNIRGTYREGIVKILANLAEKPEQALKTFWHEIGHHIDAIGQLAGNKRGNILGHMASLNKYMKRYLAGRPGGQQPLTPKEMARLRRIAKQESEKEYTKIIDEEIRTETDFTPEDILAIWNRVEGKVDPQLFDYIARLNTEQKKSIIKEAMKGNVAESVPKKIESVRVERKEVKVTETDPEKISERYRSLIEEEINKRQLLDAVREKKEIINLGVIWKRFNPTDGSKYTKYRLRNEELYADAFSAIAVEPSLVKEMAPNFWRGFMGYMENKPEVKAHWDAIQERIGKGRKAILEEREARAFKGYEKSDKQGREQQEAQDKEKKKNKVGIINDAYKKIVEKYSIIESAVKAALNAGEVVPDATNPYLAGRAVKYKQGGKRQVYNALAAGIEKSAEIKGDIDWNNHNVRKYLGWIMQNIRSAGELKDKFGPGGIQGKAATEQLAYTRKKLGPEKMKKLDDAINAFFNMRQKEVIPFLTEGPYGDMLPKPLRDKLINNREYSKRSPIRDFLKTNGRAATSYLFSIHSVKGSLKDIQNPFVATILYDNQLIQAKVKSDFVRGTIEFFEKYQGRKDIVKNIKVKKTETHGTEKGQRFTPVDGDLKTVYFMKDGKLQARNVSRDLAELLENNVTKSEGIVDAMRSWGNFNRALFIKWSIPFLARNPIRDFSGSMKNIPEYGMLPFEALKYTFKAVPEVWTYLKTGKMSPDIKQAFEEGAMPVHRLWEKVEKNAAQDDWDRLKATYEGNPVAAKRGLKRAWEIADGTMEFIGQIEEKTRKVADFKFLKEKHPKIGVEERAQKIRTSSGTPDVLAGGTWSPIMNRALLFSTANIQGQRAAYESFMKDPKRYTAKLMLYDVAPKAFMTIMKSGAAVGAAAWLAEKTGMDEKSAKWLEKAYAGIPENDLARYTCVPLPIEDKNGNLAYLKIPSDYTGQVIGATLYRAFHVRQPKGTQKLASEVAALSPISTSQMLPVFELAGGWLDYLKNGNTIDSWTNRPVIPERVAGKGAVGKELLSMAGWSYDQMGGSIIYRLPKGVDLNEKGALEKVFGLAIVGPAARSILGVTGRGNIEAIDNATYPIRQKKGKLSLDIEDKIIASLKTGKPDRAKARLLWKEVRDTLGYTSSYSNFWQRYRTLSLKNVGGEEIRKLASTTSPEERLAAVTVILDRMDLTGDERKNKEKILMNDAKILRDILKEGNE